MMNSKLMIFSVFDLIILSSRNPSFFMTSCSSVPRCFACALNFRQKKKKKKLKKATRQWHGQIFLASNCWKRSREDHLILIRIPAVHGSEISHFGYATWHAQWYQWYPPSDHHPNWCWLLPCVHKSFPAGERGGGRRRRIGVEMIHGMTRRGRHMATCVSEHGGCFKISIFLGNMNEQPIFSMISHENLGVIIFSDKAIFTAPAAIRNRCRIAESEVPKRRRGRKHRDLQDQGAFRRSVRWMSSMIPFRSGRWSSVISAWSPWRYDEDMMKMHSCITITA